MPTPEQLELIFPDPADHSSPDRGGTGYDRFAADREQAIKRLNDRFGLMLNQQIRLKLKWSDGELTDKLTLNTLLLPESKNDDVPFRIGTATFDARDIERCSIIPHLKWPEGS